MLYQIYNKSVLFSIIFIYFLSIMIISTMVDNNLIDEIELFDSKEKLCHDAPTISISAKNLQIASSIMIISGLCLLYCMHR